MVMVIHENNFYAGFEGEPELVFSQVANGCNKILRIWEGHFDTIIQHVSVSTDGNWKGLAYYYHLCLGCWGDDQEDWQIPNMAEALVQLQEIKIHQEDNDAQTAIICDALVEFLKEAYDEKISVSITRF
jgi:hypothetical protein